MQKKRLKIAVLGFSREGQSVFAFLKKAKEYKNAEITILDKNPELKTPRGVKAVLGPEYMRHLENFSVVFRSPGIPYMSTEIQRAIRHGVKVSSATNLFFEELMKMKRRPTIVGVTGTKGKGTTCTLIFECLKQAKIKALLLGNIGKPMLASLEAAKKVKVVVLELSSFQLQDLKHSPDIAVVLHVTPDHLDAHQSLFEYYEAKAQIAAHQQKEQRIFYFPANIASSDIVRRSLGQKTLVDPDMFTLFEQSEMSVPGKHNFANAVMAATVARALGLRDEAITRAITKFKGLQYRMSLSAKLSFGGGAEVLVYNDSAGTNPETAIAASRSFTDPTILILGGKDKRLDYGGLRLALMRSAVSSVVLFGENRLKIEEQLKGIPQQIVVVSGLFEKAVKQALTSAKQKAVERSGRAVVLFSPASASFDMFADYKDRGEQFDELVKKIKI